MSVWISENSSHECMDIGGQFTFPVYGYRRTVLTVPMSVWISECIDIRGQFPRVSEDSYHECPDPMSVWCRISMSV